MHVHAVVRKANGVYVDAPDCSLSLDGESAKSPRANGGAAMVCYCCCPVPYDAHYTSWLAVYSTAMSTADKPMHADDLPFPLLLPLYPDRDLLLLAFRAKPSAAASPPQTVYLHFPDTLASLMPLRLTVRLWRDAAPAWQAALKALSIGSWLAYAFDGLWTLSIATDEADMYIEHECALEEEVVAKVAGAAPADASSTSSSAEEEDSEEEEEEVLQGDESSEGNFEEEDEDAEEEEEDVDEDAEEDEDDKEEF